MDATLFPHFSDRFTGGEKLAGDLFDNEAAIARLTAQPRGTHASVWKLQRRGHVEAQGSVLGDAVRIRDGDFAAQAILQTGLPA